MLPTSSAIESLSEKHYLMRGSMKYYGHKKKRNQCESKKKKQNKNREFTERCMHSASIIIEAR